ncbi:hypothetical protein HYX09_04815 [Candidatus Woesearchaeota archaeon]|nr:hypothetical protein [Candidatus Woesearchaeota archaeon]
MTRIRPPTAQAAGAPPSAAQTELELPSLVGFEGWVVNNMPASVWVDETGRIFGSQAELTAAGGTQSTEVQPGKAFNSHNPTETMDIPGWVSGTPPAAGTPALPGTGGTPTTGQAKSVKRFARPNTDGSYTGIEIFEPVDGVRTIRVGTETVNVPEYLLEGADITRWTGAFNQDNNPTGIPLAGKTGSRNIVSDDSYHDDIQDSNGKFIGISDYTRYPSGREIIINVNNIDTPNEQTIVRQIDGDNVMETSFKPGVQNPALSDIEKITATIKGGKTTELIGSKVGELLADSAINDDMDRVFNVMSEAARLDIERITSFNPETGVLGTGTGNTYVQVLTTPNMFNVLSVKNGRATRLLDIYGDTQHFYVYSGNVRPPLDSNGNPISGNRFEIDFGQESTSIELDSNDRPVRRSIYLNENGLDTNEPLIAEYEYSYGNPDNPNDDTMLFKSGDVRLTFLNTPETFNPLSRLYQAQAIIDIPGCTMASPCWVRGTGVLDVNRDTGDRNNPVSVRQLPEEEANVFLDRLAAAKGIVGTDEEKRRKAKEILDKTDKALDADAQGDNRITRSEIDHQRFFLELETAIGNARSAGYVLGNVYSYFVNEDIIRKWQEAMESNFVTRFLTTEDAFDSAICNQFDKYELKSPSEGSAYKATPTGYDEPGAWIQATKQPFTTTGEDGARADKFLYIITFNVDMTPSSSTNTVREEVGINVGVKEQGQGFETPLLLDDGQFFPVKRERRYGRTRDTRTGGPLVFENRKNFEKACIIFDNMPFVVQGQWQVENDGKYTVCTRIKEVGGPETMEEMEARLRREQNRGQSAGGEPGADTEREAPQLSSHYWSDE